eukprot:11168918-Lingulodinium_polyedra.AAC.1
MFGGSSDEFASVFQPDAGCAVPVHGWFQGDGPVWSSVTFARRLIAGSFLSAVVVDERPNLWLRDDSVSG